MGFDNEHLTIDQRSPEQIEYDELKRDLQTAIRAEGLRKEEIAKYNKWIKSAKSELYRATKNRKDLQKRVKTFWSKKRAKVYYEEKKKSKTLLPTGSATEIGAD